MAVTMLTKAGVGALVLAGAFLSGYVPATLAARDARAEQDRLARTLALASIEVQLGMVSYEANRDNFGLAGQLATPFFDAAREALARSAGSVETHALQVVLERRDEITTGLAKADAGVKLKIAGMYADLFRVIQTAGGKAPPISP